MRVLIEFVDFGGRVVGRVSFRRRARTSRPDASAGQIIRVDAFADAVVSVLAGLTTRIYIAGRFCFRSTDASSPAQSARGQFPRNPQNSFDPQPFAK